MSPSVELLLRELRLPQFIAYYADACEQAKKDHWDYSQFLAFLSEKELAQRYTRRVNSWLHEAKLPQGKTLSSWDSEQLSSAVQSKLSALSQDTSWVDQAENLLLFGASGTGKTHSAVAIAHWMIEQGFRAKYISAVNLVQQLQQAKKQLDLIGAMTKLDKYRVIIIDDIGYVKKTEAETSVLFEFIAHRYESGSLIITANQPFSEWDAIFPDTMMTVAAIDRLIHHASIIEMNGESYRRKQQQKLANSKGGKHE